MTVAMETAIEAVVDSGQVGGGGGGPAAITIDISLWRHHHPPRNQPPQQISPQHLHAFS